MPVSVFDPATQQWVSGNFDSNPDAVIKSDSAAAATAATATVPAPWQHAFPSHSALQYGGPCACCVPPVPYHLPVTTPPMVPWCAGGAAPPHQTLSSCGGAAPSAANDGGVTRGWQCGACEANVGGIAACASPPCAAGCSSHGGASSPRPPLPSPTRTGSSNNASPRSLRSGGGVDSARRALF